MSTNIILREDINIEDMIYEVKGKQVMLDSDLLDYTNVKMEQKI